MVNALIQIGDGFGLAMLPTMLPGSEVGDGLSASGSQVDLFGLLKTGLAVGLMQSIRDVAQLVAPTALADHSRVDYVQSWDDPLCAVGDGQAQSAPTPATTVNALQGAGSVSSAFIFGLSEINQLAATVKGEAAGGEHIYSLRAISAF